MKFWAAQLLTEVPQTSTMAAAGRQPEWGDRHCPKWEWGMLLWGPLNCCYGRQRKQAGGFQLGTAFWPCYLRCCRRHWWQWPGWWPAGVFWQAMLFPEAACLLLARQGGVSTSIIPLTGAAGGDCRSEQLWAPEPCPASRRDQVRTAAYQQLIISNCVSAMAYAWSMDRQPLCAASESAISTLFRFSLALPHRMSVLTWPFWLLQAAAPLLFT